ncbi:MAG: pitrilysin family protein [Bdellovibrionaceae bacterium]|nr:pitrilysin family protein [Pseudobdellovibrionaceae bacterium]
MSFNIAQANNLSSHINLPVEKYKLKNGLTVLLNPDKKLNTASYILGFKVGSRHERKGITGISHMFEHLMFKGTKKYPNFDQIFSENGVVSVNAFTSRDYTAYVGTFPPDKLELILDVESDRMTQLTFTQEELNKERGAVQEERLMRIDNSPTGVLFENLFDQLFEKHPYRWPIIGYSEDIAKYSLEDLNKWYKTYYSPNNAVLVISGKFSAKKAKTLINKYFGNLKTKQIPTEINIKEPKQIKARSREISKKVQSSMATFSYLGPPLGTKEFYALEFISQILGTGESSVFYKKFVRQKKLLSSIYLGVIDLYHYGVFYIFYPLLDISKEEIIKKSILEELNKGIDLNLNKKSIEKVKNIYMNDMIYSLKRSRSRARDLFGYEISFNDYKKMYEKLDIIKDLSPEFIKRVGEKYLTPQKSNYIILKTKI